MSTGALAAKFGAIKYPKKMGIASPSARIYRRSLRSRTSAPPRKCASAQKMVLAVMAWLCAMGIVSVEAAAPPLCDDVQIMEGVGRRQAEGV